MKLVLKRSILGLGRVMDRDVARVLEQIKTCLRYGGERFLYALNTNTALLNINLSLSGSTVVLYRLLKKNQISQRERERERWGRGGWVRSGILGEYAIKTEELQMNQIWKCMSQGSCLGTLT